MPGLDIILVLAVIVGTVVLFVSGKSRFDLVAVSVLAALLILGLIEPEQALYGFASPATATVAAMFVLSAGLVRTGVVEWLARHLDRLAGRSEAGLVLTLSVAIAALSAFVVNTATVAIFVPVAGVLAKSRKIPPSRVLMPLSFASQFGGVCTLIGTSTNILVNAIAMSYGLEAFGLFEFAPLGLAMAATGIIYLIVVSHWLLPRRRGEEEKVDKYRLADYLAELRVTEKSPLIGQTWEQAKAAAETKTSLIKLLREERATWRPARTVIREGDVLLLHGHGDRLMGMQEKYGLRIDPDAKVSDQKLSSDKVKIHEVLIPPRSSLVGRTLANSDFARRFGCVVLALQRRGKALRERLQDIVLDEGDTLLLQCDEQDHARILKSRALIVTNELTDLYVRRDRALIALGFLLTVVLLAALGVLPILAAAVLGAVGMLLGRCLTPDEAYEAIDWKVIFLLGGLLPLGLAMDRTGTARWLVKSTLGPMAGWEPVAVLAGLYIVTAILTEVMSNNAAAVLLAPVAMSLAAAMDVSPRPLLVAITFAASTSFATPVGYQTNTMVFAPGGYRFSDYTRVGGPLNLIFWAMAVALIPRLWPF